MDNPGTKTETKPGNGLRRHSTSDPRIPCQEDDISKDVCNGSFSQRRRYNSILEYCSAVADSLPQRQAFYVTDLAEVFWKIQEWEKSLPTVESFYDVKVNSSPILLEMLVKLGLSFSCASKGEIEMILKLGGSPKNILFSPAFKPEEELEFASEKGVELVTFDSQDELYKIHRTHPNARILIRIQPSCASKALKLNKFGCDEDEAVGLLKLARQLGLDVQGVSFHVEKLCNDTSVYMSAIGISRHLFDKAEEIGFAFSILDIGCAFFGQLGKQEHFYKAATDINESLKENFPNKNVKIIADPAAYLVGSASSLVTTVLGRRCFERTEESNTTRAYYLNYGFFGSFTRIKLYGEQPKPSLVLLTESELKRTTKLECKLYGQTCCPQDAIHNTVILPDLEVGERILWKNMGAYFLNISTSFNGMPLPTTRYVFVEDQRLNRNWIDDRKHIENFLRKHATFIHCIGEDI